MLISPFYMRHRTGEYTRGMLVVDRRDDVGAYAPGDNRSQVQHERDQHHIPHGPFESAAVPAPVLTGDTGGMRSDIGVFTVVETPGSRACLDLLFQRIWGIPRQP